MERLHHYLVKIYNLHKKKSFAYFSTVGLSQGQPKIIEYLHVLDGCAQKELAKACELQPATVTSLLQKMEKDGLVHRIPETLENGTRITRIFLTQAGKNKYNSIMEGIDKVEDICFKGFTNEDTKKCLEYLKKIYQNLEEEN